jgi:Amidohydrolase family
MDTHLNDLRDEPGYEDSGRKQPGSPRSAGLGALLGSLPLRQLAGPAAVFFFWPPTHTRTPSSGGAGPCRVPPTASSKPRNPGKPGGTGTRFVSPRKDVEMTTPTAAQAEGSPAGNGPATTRAIAQGRLTVLRAARLFDGISSTLIPDPVVVLEGSRIYSVRSGTSAPDGAAVIDLADATLLPGLIDTHVHLAFDASADPVSSLAHRQDGEVTQAMVRAGRAALRGGVTTIRDLGDRGYLSLELRGRTELPTIVAAGPPITTPGGHCHYLGGAVAPTIRDVRAAVREHAARGVDVIKIMASGGNLTPGSRQDLAQFPPEVLRVAVEEAHRLGLPVTAHAHGTGAIADAVAADADGLEHVSFWTEHGVDAPVQLMRLIAERHIIVGATVGRFRCRA